MIACRFGSVTSFIVLGINFICPMKPAYGADGDYVWAQRMGGTLYDVALAITVDSAGNTYTTGVFRGTVDFDPGVGMLDLTSAGFGDAFVCKLDSSGALLWVKHFGSTNDDYGWDIALDSNGNVYTTGSFQGTVDFDPGAGTTNLTSVFGPDVFLLKLDASGNFVWARQMGGGNDEDGRSLTLDSTGNIYITGNFKGTADFDPGAGTANLTAAGSEDIFICKLDISGNYVWAGRMGGTLGDFGRSIALDSSANVYVGGYFNGTADFDPGLGNVDLTSAGSSDVFVSKLDSSGTFAWARQIGGSNSDLGLAVEVDSGGNVYTTGSFRDTVDFDPGAGTANLTASANDDGFISKLDTAGSYVWAIPLGGSGSDSVIDIALDSGGNIYTTGRFGGTADFDPGAGTANLTSVLSPDLFISKLDSTGAFVWAKQVGGSYEFGFSIAVDAYENVYASGTFQGTSDFDPGAGTANLTESGSGGGDIFTLKLSGTDTTSPMVALSSASGNSTTDSPISITATFSEPVTGFSAGDITTSNGTVDNFTGGPTVFTFDLTPLGQGAVSADIAGGVCMDITGNGNSAAAQFSSVYDTIAPTVSMSSVSSNPTNASPIAVTVTFDEPVTGFTSGDIATGNGSVSNFLGSGDTYSFDLTPISQGIVTADIAGNVAEDAASNTNSAAPQFTRTFDSIAPGLSLTSSATDPTNTSPIPITATFTETVTGFTVADITPGNGTVTNFAGGPLVYTFDLTPSGQGIVTADISGGVAQDAAANGNTAAAQFSHTFDTVGPNVSLSTSAANPTNASPIPVTITFDESVADFDAGDIAVGNGTVNNFAGSGNSYTIDVVPAGEGIVSVDIANGVAQDAAGNDNTAAIQLAREFDSIQPTTSMTATITGPTNVSPISVTVTFSKDMTDFALGDIVPSNGSTSNFAVTSQKVYTFDLVPAGQGVVSANIASGVATSTAGNPNQPGSFGIVYDSVPPVITLLGQASVQVYVDDLYVDAGATVLDSLEGDISGNLVIDTSDVDTSLEGIYTVTFNANDSAGNAATQVIRTVEVIGVAAPVPLNPYYNAIMVVLGGLLFVFWRRQLLDNGIRRLLGEGRDGGRR